MLERHELEAFLTLAEELHFGRTAERLQVSTARVSQTIAKLERRVGVPLFNRTSRRVELSATGARLYEEVRPAWDRIGAAVERAIAAGRGVTGTLRVAYVGAAGGQLLMGATELFRERHPDCEVEIREAQLTDLLPWLNDGTVEMALTTLPADERGLVTGPVLVREARMLAVSHAHPFARRKTVSMEDLARVKVLRLPDSLPESWRLARSPETTPGGRPVESGPTAASLNDSLTLVGAGKGVLVVGAQTRRYYARPDVAYIPFDDAPPVEWALIWRADGAGARVLAFDQAARDLLRQA